MRLQKLLLAMVICLGSVIHVRADLIGDTVNVQKINGPPVPAAVNGGLVETPGVEFDNGSGFTIDFDASTITLKNTSQFSIWTFGGAGGGSPAHWIFSSLDWNGQPGEIVGLSYTTTGSVSQPEGFGIPHQSVGPNANQLIDGHSFNIGPVTSNVQLFRNATYTIHLDVAHIPEPPAYLLLGVVGIVAGFTKWYFGKRKKVASSK